MKLNLFLIFFCFCSSVSFGQEDLPNEVKSFYIDENSAPKLQKILYKNKKTDRIVSEFDIDKNNPFLKLNKSSFEKILKTNTNLDLQTPLAFKSHCFTTIPSEANFLDYKSDTHTCVWYTLFVTHKMTGQHCGEIETLYSLTKLIILDNEGNIFKKIENIENYLINRSLVSDDGNYLVYNYSNYDIDTGGFEKAGFIIFDLHEDKIIYDYRSDLAYCRDIPFFSMTSGSVFQILTGRKSRDEEGLIAYIDTKEKAIYELELPSKYIVGKRLISLDFKNDGLYFEYKDGSKHAALLDIFTERFCWN